MDEHLGGGCSSHEARIVEETKVALQQERFFQVAWWNLVRHVLWLREPMGPQGAPKLEPLAQWVCGTRPGQWPLPLGSRSTVKEAGMFELCWAFVTFLWRRMRPVTPVMLMALLGILPSIMAVVDGRLVGVVQQQKPDGGQQKDKTMLALYLLAYWALVNLKGRIFYKFEVDVPLARVRHHLRHVLMRSLVRLRGDAADRFPPGESAAVLGSCVHDAIDLVWGAFFTSVRLLVALAACIAVAQVHIRKASPSVVGLVFFVFAAMPLAALALFWMHLRPCADLAARQTKWNLKMYGLAVEQVARFRSMTQLATDAELEQAAQDFGDTAFVYRKRGFHSYFMDLVNIDTVKEFCILCYSAVCGLVGLSVLDSIITVEEFVVLLSAVTSLRNGLAKAVSLLVGLPHGYAALLVIADVINSDGKSQGIFDDSNEEITSGSSDDDPNP